MPYIMRPQPWASAANRHLNAGFVQSLRKWTHSFVLHGELQEIMRLILHSSYSWGTISALAHPSNMVNLEWD